MVEKHMLPAMDLDGNQKMDWFFNEYVYGTELPAYGFESSWDDKMNLKIKLTQSNVSPNFKMTVPIYMELADGRVVRLGSLPVVGNNSNEQVVPLGNALKDKPKRVMINYYYDVLAGAQ
jgi:aminopeptidase N